MKRWLFLMIFVLSIMNVYSDELWDSKSLQLNFWTSNDLIISNNRTYSVTMHNPKAQTKADAKANIIVAESATINLYESRYGSTSPNKKISFEIEDINNDTSRYKYAVVTEDGATKYTNHIYWGATIYLKGESGANDYYVEIVYSNQGAGMLYGASKSYSIEYNVPGKRHNTGYQTYYWSDPSCLEIELFGDNQCRIRLGYAYSDFMESISGVTKVQFDLYYGAKIRVYDAKVQTETLYSKVSAFVNEGKSKMKNGEYLQAAMEFSKAIDKGYENYDIYKLRAEAYCACEFYNNALDDCNKALQYKQTAELYFLRGKAKFFLSDISCLDDLERGGVEGIAIAKEIRSQLVGANMDSNAGMHQASSGSGIVLSKNGIIATNFHVIDGATKIDVLVNRNGIVKTYKAKILLSDKTNDLSLLKIEDSSFTPFAYIPYTISTKIADVGTSVFALGYPMSDVLGEEIKLTDGLISSKTGYQGDITTYQISAPIQPGNSGGPLFNKRGELVGITNAGVPDAQNVGYAIKTSYLKNLVDVAPETVALPTYNAISELPFTDKVKKLTPFVVLIKVY